MKNWKYTTTFSSVIKPVVSEEKDKYLALASMVELEKFLPDVDLEKNVDLLPVAFNAFVANRVNKNGDVVDTDTAIAMYDNFKNKPINIKAIQYLGKYSQNKGLLDETIKMFKFLNI